MNENFCRIDFRHPLIPEDGLIIRPEKVLICYEIEEVRDTLFKLEAALKEGFHAAGFISYDTSAAFDPAMQVKSSDLPLLIFYLSKKTDIPKNNVDNIHFFDWQPEWDEKTYEKKFDEVQEHIKSGDCYQLNLTFPLRSKYAGNPMAAYDYLKNAQSCDYAGYIQHDGLAIASASPELFFKKTLNHLLAKPMKGTRPRSSDPNEDQDIARELSENPKDRAENVMIVDLLRNDLGRIAKAGSVKVEALFEAEAYPTLWQMTSTISAELEENKSLYDIFSALFPCGSITGAPKIKSMELINEIEQDPRLIYCGSMAYLHPNGEAIFNVAIRTMILQNNHATYAVGSGLVSDSHAQGEYEECILKARILEQEEFQILETLLWQNDYILLDNHIKRMAASAEYFDYPFSEALPRQKLNDLAQSFTVAMRVRILLNKKGDIELESTPLQDNPFKTVRLANEAVHSHNPFLRHKTTCRTVYKNAYEQRAGANDVILYNERAELTESTIGNIALLIDDEWLTPHQDCGLLPGTLREDYLEKGKIKEAILQVDDLEKAEKIALMNSVRGFWEVELLS